MFRIAFLFSLFFFSLPAFANNLTIVTAKGETHLFNVDLAISADEQIKGLMGRKTLPNYYGMLFVNDPISEVTFWMKDTLVPLDMVFIDGAGKIVKIHQNARPLSETNITSRKPVKATLEVLGGTTAQKGIKVGDVVHHKIFGNTLDTKPANRYKDHRSTAGN